MSPPAESSTDTLDKEMEKDTWNFKSMVDDPMDFGFESPAKNKKSAFKLDMGFDLGGDFENLSSFKMDMPDFDFSSPAKKTLKKKESSDDKSSGNSKPKKNPFAFSYDFDALDDFDLDSSPPKKGSEPKTTPMDCKETSAKSNTDKSDALDFGPELPITKKAAPMATTNVKAKASAENENQNIKTSDTMVVDSSTHSTQATLKSRGNLGAVESPPGPRTETSPTHTMCLPPQSANTSLSKETSPLERSCPSVEDTDELCPSNETAAPSPVYASETALKSVNRQTSQDNHEICRSSPKEDSPRVSEHNVDDKMVFTMESSYEKTEQTASSISSQSCSDRIEDQQEELDTGTQAEIQDHTKKPLCDSDAGKSQAVLSGKISPGTLPSRTAQVQDSSGKLPLDPSHSMPRLNDLKVMHHNDSGFVRSRFFKKPEKPQSHVVESSPNRTEVQPVTQERIVLSSIPTNDKRHDKKDVSPGSNTRTCLNELVNMDSEKKAAKVNTSSSREKIIHKDLSNAKTVENVSGLMDHLKLQAKNTTREKSILQINISSKLDASTLTQKLSRHLSSGAESLQKSKLATLERPKLGNTVSDLRTGKPLRTIGVNSDQPSPAAQPEVSTSICNERNTIAPVKKSSEIHHLAPTPRDRTQINQCPSSLKRKALDEDVDKSLKPQLKRFSVSPRENRNIEETPRRVVKGTFSSQESRMDLNTTKEVVKEIPQTKSHRQIINMANVEIPITENTSNIEKAEAFTKELDIICNILRKKHEEAKELLVRAVVNNNKLLILNHPLHDDKIRMIQKFAAKLTLRDT